MPVAAAKADRPVYADASIIRWPRVFVQFHLILIIPSYGWRV